MQLSGFTGRRTRSRFDGQQNPKPAEPEPSRLNSGAQDTDRKGVADETAHSALRRTSARGAILLPPIVTTGTLPGVCYAQGMTSFLYAKSIRIFVCSKISAPLRDRVRVCAQALAAKHGATIQHIIGSLPGLPPVA